MRALVYRKSIPRYLLMRAGAKRVRNLETSRLSPLQLEEVPEPELPGPGWVRVRPLLAGICGSDLGTLSSENSPYFSPLTSPPFVMGHEIFGVVAGDGEGFRGGERVVLEPALGCAARGIDPPCARCAAGQHALCVNVTRGSVSPGIQTGFCRDTGGGWCEGTLVAHRSQLHRVPDDLPDEAAVLLEPLACAVHAALAARPGPKETVLVIGAGSIGLLTVAALRALTGAERILCAAKHPRQREEALRLGASEVIAPKELYERLPGLLGASRHKPELGKPVVLGGADAVLDCVGSPGTMEDAVRLARPGGRAVLVGMPGARSCLDLSALWHKEVSLTGAYAYGTEEHRGERLKSFELALRLAPELELERLVGPRFCLADYREAIAAARAAGRRGHVKVVFDHRAA
ncbi:Alcohol dehydrogenase, zinc-binding protein [Rubrobacter xylanophilus DSM 9941]|uniref:Alcohol dehydrogenase, zinc-binding protein n=1 Tax=Rubrobacter xylanophilus (strain DSM 9941 / JCM 11954 / NBRC 16129 / PRD-1) TaxID=266117 RepID=Q1AU73_RUBXD|nr:zinc-binding dehydrogenase [Rubrobacter xylanophilus]ABG05055.1 Alcohol dehydrogenase, zinc-binding protein [Rubrobacter xylanophilus DSM 9941]